MFHWGMGKAEDAEIRRANFRALWPSDSFSPTEAVRKLGRTASLWSDLYHGRKSFGEKIARYIEERLGLVRLSLDDPEGPRPTPLSNELMDAVAAMDEAARRRLENQLRVQFDMPPLPPQSQRVTDRAAALEALVERELTSESPPARKRRTAAGTPAAPSPAHAPKRVP